MILGKKQSAAVTEFRKAGDVLHEKKNAVEACKDSLTFAEMEESVAASEYNKRRLEMIEAMQEVSTDETDT